MTIRIPTALECRAGARMQASRRLAESRLESLLLVADPGLETTPWVEELGTSLIDAGLRVEPFQEIEPNPRTTTAERAAQKIRSAKLQGVVALGGGSALDAAKAAAMLATNPGRAEDFAGAERFEHPALPLLALPTTCGTGSEVTWVAVLTHEASRTKLSLKGVSMFPRWALVDPDLLTTLPPLQVATTGLDALTHAIEAATCLRSTPFSRALAVEAIRRILAFLPCAHADIQADAPAREAMAWASTLAGMAFGNADVAAVHCLSESIGGRLDLPHGLLNASLLVPVLEALSPDIDDDLTELARMVRPDRGGAGAFLDDLQALVQHVGVPSIRELGIPLEEVPAIAEAAEANGSNASNVRPLRASDYRRWLESWLG